MSRREGFFTLGPDRVPSKPVERLSGLAPCPFCGAVVEIRVGRGGYGVGSDVWFFWCTRCFAQGPRYAIGGPEEDPCCPDEDSGRKAWNWRLVEDSTVEGGLGI
jgi:hypothetical protein